MVSESELVGFIVAGFALTGSPGPATLSLAAAAAAFGARGGLVLAAGCIAGVCAVMAVTASGLTAMVLAQPVLGTLVKAAAAGYMAYLAWRIATAPPLDAAHGRGGSTSFFAGILLGVGNPKAYAAMAALFGGATLIADDVAADLLLKAALLVVIMAIVNLAWLILGAALTRLFHDPVKSRMLNIGFALLLIASVAVALLR
jgi:threonine/homoserine/homoserine lactone efflux protein